MLIFDRGYFSNELVRKIQHLNKDFLFRLPKNLNIVKTLEASQTNDQVITLKGKSLRVIKYQIPSIQKIAKNNQGPKPFKMIIHMNNYYLATTLTDQITYSIEVLKELYHQRWSVEECYKTIKGNFHAGTFHSILPQSIECEMAAQQLSAIITRLFIGMMNNSKKHKVNSKICTKKIVNDVLPMLMFDKQKNSYLKNILDILELLEKIVVLVRQGRSFQRIKRFRSDKFLYKKKEPS